MKADNWTQQQLFGLDFDNEMCIEEAYNKVISLGIINVSTPHFHTRKSIINSA